MAEWFNANPRYAALAQDLIDAEPANLGHVDLSTILFLEIRENKPKQPMVIKKINEPFVTLLGKLFYVAVNEELTSNLDTEHLELEMFRILLHIDVEPGKMKFPEVFEFKCILNHFGTEWRDQQIQSVLDMLKNGVKVIA